jgi:hypothetical protein
VLLSGGFIVACATAACGIDLDIGSNEVPYDAACMPGTYTGTYQCMVSSGGSSALSANGTLSVQLIPAGAHVLALPQDASLVSTMSGTTSVTALSGELDCSTRQLVGRDGPVGFSSSTFMTMVNGTGKLTATYDADASPPQLIDGVLDSPPTLGSTCVWTATRQP